MLKFLAQTRWLLSLDMSLPPIEKGTFLCLFSFYFCIGDEICGMHHTSCTINLLLTKNCWLTVALKGAATLKVRSGCKNRLNGGTPILPIEDNNDLDFDFEKGRTILAQGAELYVETPEGT